MADTVPYIELFSGVAGLGLGLKIAVPGAVCLAHCERERAACEVLAARIEEGSLDPAPIFTDVRSFPGRAYRGSVEGVVGGSPCTDLSVAGKRAGIGGAKSTLFHDYIRIVEESDPDWFFFENVGGVVSSRTLLHRTEIVEHLESILRAADESETPRERWHLKRCHDRLHRRLLEKYGISALLYIRCCMEAIGYRTKAGLFTAAEAGASHRRERIFVFAWKPGTSLAHLTGRGLGELRESFRGDGQPDGRDSQLGDAEGDGQSRSRSRSQGQSQPTGGSGTCELAHPSRHERRGPHREAGARRGVCEAGDTVAGPGNGFIPQSGRGPERRDGTGPAEPLLAHPEHPKRRAEHEEHADSHGRDGSGRESGDLGHPDDAGLEGWEQRQHGADERITGATGDSELADTGCERNERWREPGGLGEESREVESEAHKREWRGGAVGDSLPIFAPGPSDPRWPDILREHPELAPAISEEETERLLHLLVDGFSSPLAGSRTDGLRACGNAVVAATAALALITLARRAELA